MKNFKRAVTSFILIHTLWGEKISDGIYPNEPESKTEFWISRYLPYNPEILVLDQDEKVSLSYWPHAKISFENPLSSLAEKKADLVWVISKGSELLFLQNKVEEIKEAKVIYTSTHFFHDGAYFKKQKSYLESLGFSLLLHWYEKDEEGRAIFVKDKLLIAEKNCLSNLQTNSCLEEIDENFNFKPFLKCIAPEKTESHSFGPIDFIYMINLDERPEKFQKATEDLHLCNIFPFRFSAVNGWKLPIETFQNLGSSFTQPMLQSDFLGSTFQEHEGNIHRTNELIEEGQKNYYSLGISHGAVGIILSHLSILQDAYDRGFETIWVMEDDIELLENPTRLLDHINELDNLDPAWDILFTDTDTKSDTGEHIPCRALAGRPNFHVKPLDFFLNQFYPLSPNLSHIGMRYGTYSMIVKRSGVKKILDFYQKYKAFLPFDMDFWLTGEMNMYSLSYDLISHRANSPSDNGYPTYDAP